MNSRIVLTSIISKIARPTVGPLKLNRVALVFLVSPPDAVAQASAFDIKFALDARARVFEQ